MALTALACSSGTNGTFTVPDGDAGGSEPTTDAGANGDVVDREKDASKPDAKDEPEPVPSAPFFDVTINGKTMVVKDVTVKPTNVDPGSGISYYDITATLAQTPPIAAGLQDDPSIVIRVGKDESGSDVCKEKRGPQVGFVQPVIELREVQVRYRRFTGTSTVTAYPSTKQQGGACNMQLKAAATAGQAWGEAKGTVQAGADEPAMTFDAKWFQTFSWK